MGKTVIDYLKFNSENYGAKYAVVCEDKHISFDELYKKVSATAAKIGGLYSESGKNFAIENKRSIGTIVLMLSVVALGGCYRVVEAFDDSMEEYILLSEEFVSNEDGKFCVSNLHCDAKMPTFEICTSGTTGEPKKIVKTIESLLEFIVDFADKFQLSNEDVFLNQLEFTFDASTKDIYSMVVLGATLHIGTRKNMNFPVVFAKYLKDNEITVFITTPFFIKNIAKLKGLFECEIKSLRYVMFVGEAMKSEYLNYWIEELTGTSFVNLYGSSELAGNSLYCVIDKCLETEYAPLKDGFLDYEYKIENDELIICSLSHNVEYKTGDMVEVYENERLFITGRCDNIRKIRGYRVSLEAVEREIEKLECVKEALCEQVEDSLCVLIISNGECDIKQIQIELKSRLPKYVQPVKIKLVEELPVNGNGKVDRSNTYAKKLE